MDSKKKSPLAPKATINYLFFGIYFAIIAIIHVFHVFLIESTVSFSAYFFAIYGIAQCFIETMLLILFGAFIKNHFQKLMNLYIVAVFFLFLSHVIDFPLVRLVDMSFWYALHFVSQESYGNFIELLIASNVSILVWTLAGACAILVLFSGMFFYRMTEKWTKRHQLAVSFPLLTVALLTSVSLLIVWDLSVKTRIPTHHFDRYAKTLPLKSTLFPPVAGYMSLKSSLQEPEGEKELMQKLDSRIFSLNHKPDIYLFVIESLRDDYITAENAPHLNQFKEQNVSFDLTLSNANATHLSWFSLFHSKFPFYWGKIDPEDSKGGSIPLQLLRRMGYKIHVASSARLSYYQMNRLIFGEGEHLADSIFFPNEEECYEPYMRDQSAIDHLLEQMNQEGSGRLFIVFLDATHFDYSWPKEASRFNPFMEKINYFKVVLSNRGIDGIINRYRNSLYFVDSQFGKFVDALHKVPGGKEAVVIVTADHGEEFYEHGNLFHASTLSHPQINPPLYYKFGGNERVKQRVKCAMTCHMDIFPTLFHYLIGDDLMQDVLQGQSIFKADRWPYTVIARCNFSRTPYEYCIHNGTEKLTTEFSNETDIFSSLGLKILSKKNCREENLKKGVGSIHEDFEPAMERIFSVKK
jgi:membrane-anchored protein YejM (alkaline phosphatase superfamily)